MKKRFLSVVLCLCLVVGLLPTTAMATSKTTDDAIAWVRSQVGHSVGVDDGSGYYQCVEFIQAYYQWLGVGAVSGNGYDYATNKLPDGWTRTAGGIPQKGDILVYSKYSNTVQQYGHVAIYESDNVLYDQDGSVWGATVKREEKNYRTYTYNYWGCIHPNFASAPSQPTVTPSNIKPNFYATIYYPHGGKLLEARDSGRSDYPVNVQLNSQDYASVDSSDPRCIWHFIRHDNDGSYSIVNEYYGRYLDVETGVAVPERNVGTWYDGKEDNPKRWFVTNAWGSDRWYSLLTALDYPAYALDVYKVGTSGGTNVQIYNRGESNFAQQFNIVEQQSYKKPSRPSAPSNIQATTSSQNTTIIWNAVPTLNSYDTREYELKIYNTGTGKYVVSGKRVSGTSYTYILPEGNYRAEVKSINTKYLDYTSDWASKDFTVSSTLSENGTVKLTARTVPTASAITYGQRLMDSKLTSGTVVDSSGKINGGFWSWEKWNSYPPATGNYKAVFNPLTEEYNSVIYSSLSAQVAVTVNKATPNLSVSATQNGTTVNISTSASNPYNTALTDVPTPTVTYRIGNGVAQRVTGSSFTIPENTKGGTTITVTASIAGNEYYQAAEKSTTVTVANTVDETVYHILTTSGSDLGGVVSIQPDSAKQGEAVTITATPRNGYKLESVTATETNGSVVQLTSLGGDRYAFTMPKSNVTLNVIFGVTQDDWVNPFSDVVEGAWYYDAVKFVNRSGLMSGIGNGVFSPSSNLSRAQLAQILYNSAGNPKTTGSSFTDVPVGQWYSNAIAWAADQGIVSGYGGGRFGPNDNITREQLAVILWRHAGSPTFSSGILNFTDAGRINSYAWNAVRWAVANGIISGTGGGVLDPQGPATRAQVAQMLKNYLGNH